jgi:hypothetical protein
MKALRVWVSFIWICTGSLVLTQLISRDEASLKPSTVELFNHFFSIYWEHDSWRGTNGWTGDAISRLMVTYLSSQQHHLNQSDVEVVFTHIASRSLNAWTLLQYLTQANDDFGWTVVLLLDTLQYTHKYAELYPHSDVAARLPILRNRLAFRAGFLHDVMAESWTPEFCQGGVEWYVRPRRRILWPSLYAREIYKNTITNHLYNGNNAQIYKAHRIKAFPVGVTEIAVYGVRNIWKVIRPALGWPKSYLQPFDFADIDLLRKATEGIEWVDQAGLMTNKSLYVDGIRPRFRQASPETESTAICDVRDESIYTYNQVAGLRALYFLSRNSIGDTYLRKGHRKVQNLIDATSSGSLGWNGILEERCDKHGNCSQDMQAFKGVVFLELQNFCGANSGVMNYDTRSWHTNQCRLYTPWVRINAIAAISTLDKEGRFGGYWGLNHSSVADNGRGRTVETQFSALAAQLALLVFDGHLSV